ncbi:MAG: ABC transporter substrate-binding protein [Armatimonadota bacterium]|nr:ABC transporter substrate-binding protein [Armatimonadota bacterium]MDR7452130.1 ABC transporter substrate-binding protein [Armatimonadota bacterium]MDR7467854.1 ABC transporter substrate-binding protein [Armatimonadota bacterium]MDR7494742.1 ABC transporter substrate-binding protein [Armatimonadota bacterium]MDR7499567.1 ABC transporter substrate-binding protein [Armatimonadota bacterium]
MGLLAAVLIPALLAAPGAGGAAVADRVTIGFFLPLTGAAAAEGNGVREGADLAAKQINDAGGISIGGRRVRIELVYEDDRCSPQGATEAANRLVARRVDFVGGSFCSSAALAAQPIFAQARIPQIIYAFATDLTGAAREKAGAVYSVRLGPQAKIEMAPLAKYAVLANNHRTFFAMGQNTDFGRSMVTEFRAVLEKLGGRFVAEPEYFSFGATDFRTILTRAKGSGAQALLAIGLLGEMIGITLQYRELGLTQGFYGSDLLENTPYMEAVGDRNKGFYSPWFYDDGVDERRFRRSEPEREPKTMALAVLKAFGRRATRDNGWGWGTVHLVRQAMEKAGTTNNIAAAEKILSGEKFVLPYGTYGFTRCGQADMRAGVAMYEGGFKKVLVTDRDYASTPPVVLTTADLCPQK